MLEESQSKFPSRAQSGDRFETKSKDNAGRVTLRSESEGLYPARGTMLVFEHNISYVISRGTFTARFRNATVISDDIVRLPDGKEIPVQDLVPNQTARVVLSSDIVDEDLRRHGIVEI